MLWFDTRYTAPIQLFQAFQYLMQETKEYFLGLHLDGKKPDQLFGWGQHR